MLLAGIFVAANIINTRQGNSVLRKKGKESRTAKKRVFSGHMVQVGGLFYYWFNSSVEKICHKKPIWEWSHSTIRSFIYWEARCNCAWVGGRWNKGRRTFKTLSWIKALKGFGFISLCGFQFTDNNTSDWAEKCSLIAFNWINFCSMCLLMKSTAIRRRNSLTVDDALICRCHQLVTECY